VLLILIWLEIVLHVLFHCREFLTGFKRRKDERRRKAKEEIQKTIKAEKKRIMKKVAILLHHDTYILTPGMANFLLNVV